MTDDPLTLYKAVRLDMTSHYDRKTRWEVGVPVKVTECDPPTNNGCGRGIHASRTLLGAVVAQFGPSEYLTVNVDPQHIIQETKKVRVSECLPTHFLTQQEQDGLAGFRLYEANHPINPLRVKGNALPEPELRRLLTDWDSVWDSVRDSVWDSVWASVRDSVGDSVGVSVRAYTGSLFPNITTWRGTDLEHPWESLRTLWLAGYVPSFDGRVWRLHRGPNAEVVLTVPKEELHEIHS